MADETMEAEVWALIRSIFESFANRNEQQLERPLADDCTVWDVFEPGFIQGREERHAFHERDREQSERRGKLAWDLVPLRVDQFGDMAVARYYLDFSYQPPYPASGRIRITDVLQQTEDGWQIVHHHEGMSPQGPPGFEN